MLQNKARKIIATVLIVLLATAGSLIAFYHDAAYAVLKNLTVKTIPMDESTEWEGGASYIGVPYSDVSESDYVDIYVPADVENPPLMVIVHGGGFIANDSQSRQAQKMYRYFRDHDYACATVNYRLAQEAPYPAALQDVKACVRFLKANADKYGYSTDQISIFGESAGGYLASAAAVSGDAFCDLPFIGEDAVAEKPDASVDVLIDFYGANYLKENDLLWKDMKYPSIIIKIANSWLDTSELEGYAGCTDYFLRKDLATISEEENHEITMDGMMEKGLDENSTLRTWITHGDCDITVPLGISQMFYDSLMTYVSEDSVVFNIVPGAGHASDILYSDEELAKIDAFLREE